MYRFLVVLAFALVYVASQEKEEQCKKLRGMKMLKCCKGLSLEKAKHLSEMKECRESIKPLQSPEICEYEICLAKKLGYAGDIDGKFDHKAVESNIREDLGHKPELAELIIKNCIKEDLEDFGDKDMCDLIKLKMCIHKQVFKTCDSWDSEGDCKGAEELVKLCTSM